MYDANSNCRHRGGAMEKVFNFVVVFLLIFAGNLYSMDRPTSEGLRSRLTSTKLEKHRIRMQEQLRQAREQAERQAAERRQAERDTQEQVGERINQRRLFED